TVSLTEVWSGEEPAPALAELIPGLKPPERMHALAVDELHYIRNPDGREELYDWRADPAGKTDLAALPGFAARRARLSALRDDARECRRFDCVRVTRGAWQ